MNVFRILALQDLSHILPAKSVQHETHVPMIVFKRCLSNFLNSSRKQKNAHESIRRINLSTVSNNLEPIFTTWMASPEITTTTFNSRFSAYFLSFKTNTEKMHLETLKPLIKYDELLDGNPVSRSKCCKTLPNIQAGDFGFVYNEYNDSTVIKSDKVYYDDCASKIIFALQEDQQPRIDHTIEQVSTDDLSTCTTVKNVDSPFLVKAELKTPELQHQQSGDLFETLQQLNTMTKPRGTTDTAKQPAFSKIEILRNIPLKWSSMERSYPRREHHTWKSSKIENDAIRCDDHRFFASDIRTMRQKQSAGYESSRFHHLAYSGSLENQGFRKSSLCLPSVPRRVFSSRSCTVMQQSIREIKTLRKDLSANTSIVRLRSTRSHPDHVFLAKQQSFSCDASRSKKSADCEDDKSQRSKREDEIKDTCSQEVAKSRCRIESKKICRKTRRKDTRASSQDDTCEKRQQKKSKSCKNYMCPELKRQKPCSWDADRCPEARRKCDAKGRVSSRDRARQSRDSDCSQERGRQSKSYKRREDCEKSDEPRAVCKDTIKERNDCKPKCEKRRKERDISEKERRKCTGSSRKRSNSCRRINSSRAGDKSCNKVDGKRRYSQQSIFSVPQDRKSFSTLIPDIALGTNISKTTQRFYASCSKDEKDRKQSPSCEKRRRKCETKEKDEIKKRCVKGPAKCISRKKTIHKLRTCQSTQKDKHKKSCKSTKKSNREEFCTSRKKEFMKNEKLKTDSVKPCTSSIMKDKKPKEQSMKGQIGREYKEIDECKKGFKKEKGGNKAKMVSVEHKPSGLGRIISSYKEQKKDSEKFASTPNESITSTDTIFKWFIIQSRVINDKLPIVAKDVRLFNIMFDRSFSTAKLDYQDDFAIERTMSNGEMAQNYSANSDDFIHDDELPNYVEIEYEDEEDDVYDIGPLVDRSPESIESYTQNSQKPQ